MISAAEIERYHQDGFIVVEDVFSTAEIAAMRQVLDDLVAGAIHVSTHNEVYDLEPDHTSEAPRVRRIKFPTNVDPLFDRMARQENLLRVLKALIGPDLRLYGSKINIKAAAYGSPVEWHQDWAFYPHTNDNILAVGVMLDDMTEDNGPMMMLPGSHRGPIYDHHHDGYFAGAIAPDQLDVSGAETVLGRAGACSFHHVRAVHGSAQNQSSQARRLLLLEVAAADAWPLMGLRDGFGDFEEKLLAGVSHNHARLTDCPVRMPLPPAKRQGSIYESQAIVQNRYFKLAASAKS